MLQLEMLVVETQKNLKWTFLCLAFLFSNVVFAQIESRGEIAMREIKKIEVYSTPIERSFRYSISFKDIEKRAFYYTRTQSPSELQYYGEIMSYVSNFTFTKSLEDDFVDVRIKLKITLDNGKKVIFYILHGKSIVYEKKIYQENSDFLNLIYRIMRCELL